MPTGSFDSILFLDEAAITGLLDLPTALRLVEQAFVADGLGQVHTFPVVSYSLEAQNAGWVIKSGAMDHASSAPTQHDVLGLKAGAYWPNNEDRGMATHNATILLIDVRNGCVSSVLGGNLITSLRTAAGGAIASKWLALADPEHIAILGAGEQAERQLEAHLCLFPCLKHVTIWNRTAERADAMAAAWSAKGLSIRSCSTAHEAVEQADIVVTTTAARHPLLFTGWLKAGAHISAIGSDAPGKQEIDADLVAHCALFVDKTPQSIALGEMQQPLARGLVEKSHILAELGEVCAGLHPGRRSRDEITLFDSSGVSFQDLVLADYVHTEADKQGLGTRLAR